MTERDLLATEPSLLMRRYTEFHTLKIVDQYKHEEKLHESSLRLRPNVVVESRSAKLLSELVRALSYGVLFVLLYVATIVLYARYWR